MCGNLAKDCKYFSICIENIYILHCHVAQTVICEGGLRDATPRKERDGKGTVQI